MLSKPVFRPRGEVNCVSRSRYSVKTGRPQAQRPHAAMVHGQDAVSEKGLIGPLTPTHLCGGTQAKRTKIQTRTPLMQGVFHVCKPVEINPAEGQEHRKRALGKGLAKGFLMGGDADDETGQPIGTPQLPAPDAVKADAMLTLDHDRHAVAPRWLSHKGDGQCGAFVSKPQTGDRAADGAFSASAMAVPMVRHTTSTTLFTTREKSRRGASSLRHCLGGSFRRIRYRPFPGRKTRRAVRSCGGRTCCLPAPRRDLPQQPAPSAWPARGAPCHGRGFPCPGP